MATKKSPKKTIVFKAVNPFYQNTEIPLQKRKEEFGAEKLLRIIFQGVRKANQWAKANRPHDWDKPMTDRERYLDYIKAGHTDEEYWGWKAVPAKVRRANYEDFVKGMYMCIGKEATEYWVNKHPFLSFCHRKEKI